MVLTIMSSRNNKSDKDEGRDNLPGPKHPDLQSPRLTEITAAIMADPNSTAKQWWEERIRKEEVERKQNEELLLQSIDPLCKALAALAEPVFEYIVPQLPKRSKEREDAAKLGHRLDSICDDMKQNVMLAAKLKPEIYKYDTEARLAKQLGKLRPLGIQRLSKDVEEVQELLKRFKKHAEEARVQPEVNERYRIAATMLGRTLDGIRKSTGHEARFDY